MSFLDALLQRPVITSLAILGAVLATLGSVLKYRDINRAHIVTRVGYAIAWVSLALFIIAGFRSAYT